MGMILDDKVNTSDDEEWVHNINKEIICLFMNIVIGFISFKEISMNF